MKRSITGLIAAVGIVLACGSAEAASAVVLRDLNVRAGPGTSFPVIGNLPRGVNIEVLACNPGWCTIGWPGPAFVSAAYLGFNGPPPYVNGPLVIPVAPVAVPVVPSGPMVVMEPNPAVMVAPPPPVYYGPPPRLYVNPPPPPVPGFYGGWGVWSW